MKYFKISKNGTIASVALFNHGRREAHVILTSDNSSSNFTSQISSLYALCSEVQELIGMRSVFCRYFLSDATNQAPMLANDVCATTVINQSPLNGSKIAMWLILQQNSTFHKLSEGTYEDDKGRVWMGDTTVNGTTPETLTINYLQHLQDILNKRGGSLLDNCLRTWFFVRDVDVNYAEVVRGRNKIFESAGLTKNTHFISSTGIGGSNPDSHVPVSFNAVADTGLNKGQMKFLYGASHLNPTIEYGVAFERGTTVDYADRRHVYISGTASINNRGEIVHPGDIEGQCERMIENIGILLTEADCAFHDVAHFIIYLRDVADYAVVNGIFSSKFPDVPRIIVQAPVCRPGWLIETECMAIKFIDSEFDEF